MLTALRRSDPWEQRLDEPDICYRQFVAWLQRVPRSAPNDNALAAAYGWSERAITHDNAHALPSTPGALVERGMTDLLKTLAIEAGKLFGKSSSEIDSVLTPKEIGSLYAVIAGLTQREFSTAAKLPDLSGLNIDQINELIKNLRGLH
jgi:hypothetical protein